MLKTKKLFFMGLIIFVIVLFGCTKVEAVSYNLNSLQNSKNLYCINHSGHMSSNVNASYSVAATINIVGNIATTTKNGTTYKSNSYVHGQLAYILAGGNYVDGYGTVNSKNPRQLALWNVWNNWYKTSSPSDQLNIADLNLYDSANSAVGIESGSTSAKLLKEATEYSTGKGTEWPSITLISKSNKCDEITSEGKFYGPFRVKYSDTIHSIGVFDVNSKTIDNKNIEICTRKSLSSAISKGSKNTYYGSNLPNNQDFYIYVKDSSIQVNSFKINVESSKCIAVKVEILKSTTKVRSGIAQKLIRVTNLSSSSQELAELTVGFAESTEITIKKYDAYTSEVLEGAEFILRHNNKVALLEELNDGTYSVYDWIKYYDDDYLNESIIKVGKDGAKIKVKRDDITLYAFEEVNAPDGYSMSLGYLSKSASVSDNKTYGDRYGLNGSKYYFDLNTASTKAEINFSNSKKVTLTIDKVNAKDVNQKLPNVKFYLKHDNKFAIVTGSSSNYEVTGWTTDQDQATEIITDSDGKMVITLVEDPQKKNNQFIYGLVEIENPNDISATELTFISGEGTSMQNQDVDGYKLSFYLNYEYGGKGYLNMSNLSMVVGNNMPEYKEVILKKVAAGNTSRNVNATFVIAHNNSYARAEQEDGVWVIKEWLPYNMGDYTLESDKVTKIKLVNGEAKIKLPIDDKLYGFIETETETGYQNKLGYLAEQSKNITPLDSSLKEWASERGIDKNGILNNWYDEDTKMLISEFFFYINQNIVEGDEIKVCLTNSYNIGSGVEEIVVSGNVWLDTGQGKENYFNKIYDSGDDSSPVSVTVSLREKGTGKVAQYTYADSRDNYKITSPNQTTSTNNSYYLSCNKAVVRKLRRYYNINKVEYYYNVDVIAGYEYISLSNYYIQFSYSKKTYNSSTKSYTLYRPITYNIGDAGMYDYKNNSKANLDSELTYTSYASIRNFDLYASSCYSTYTKTGYIYRNRYASVDDGDSYYSYNWTTTSVTVGHLSNMNLGLMARIDTSGTIVEELQYVRIVMPNQNGTESYTYIYEYGTEEAGEVPVSVSFGNKTLKNCYTRPFYPSDIYRTLAKKNEKMQVYVVYSITITNSDPMDGEIYMQVLSLKNEYDNERYILDASQSGVSNSNVQIMQKDFGNWTGITKNGKSYANYNITKNLIKAQARGHSRPEYGYVDVDVDGITKLASKDFETFYIQFKVTEAGLIQILQNPSGISENNPTKATTSVQHYTKDIHYEWCDSENCNGHRCTIREVSEVKDISADAPYMIFKIDENNYDRTVQGNVFYDKNTEIGESEIGKDVIGNGIKDSDDGFVEGVTVELRLSNGDYWYNKSSDELFDGIETQLATIYYIEGNKSEDWSGSNETAKGVPAITTTDANGNYSFTGVVPGDYFLVFKYPDGHEEYKASNDNRNTNNSSGENSNVSGIKIHNVKEYADMTITTANYLKSTVVKNEYVKEAIINTAVTTAIGEWYRKLEGGNSYSVAVDNLSLRTKLNDEQWNKLYGDGTDLTVNTMVAGSAPFRIKIESDDADTCIGGSNTLHKCDYSMFNFGIIRQPKQKASIEKVITNVKLTHDPQVIFDGNPQELSSQNVGVTDLDGYDYNNGSTYTRVEIDKDALYGSTLTLTYDLRVKNESENNYYEVEGGNYGYYYMFGDKTNTKLVTLSTIVDDYLDKYLTYNSVTENAVMSELSDYNNEKTKLQRTLQIQDYSKDNFTIISNGAEIVTNGVSACLSDDETLMYQLSCRRKIRNTETEIINLAASKLLSGREEEWNYQNSADIVQLKNRTNNETEDNKYTALKEDNETETKSVKLVVTPEKSEPSKANTETGTVEKVSITEKNYPNTEIVITTPTGGDKNTYVLYSITGVISLIILVGGIVIIKKKVL